MPTVQNPPNTSVPSWNTFAKTPHREALPKPSVPSAPTQTQASGHARTRNRPIASVPSAPTQKHAPRHAETQDHVISAPSRPHFPDTNTTTSSTYNVTFAMARVFLPRSCHLQVLRLQVCQGPQLPHNLTSPPTTHHSPTSLSPPSRNGRARRPWQPGAPPAKRARTVVARV